MTQDVDRILIASPDETLAAKIQTPLVRNGHTCQVCRTEEALWEQCGDGHVDMLLLDTSLDNFSSIFKTARTWMGSLIYVLGPPGDSEALMLLDMGADDYLEKTASPLLIAHRIRARLRSMGAGTHELRAERIRIVPEEFEVYKGGQKVNLSTKEFLVFYTLVRHPRRVFSAKDLYERVWRGRFDANRDEGIVQAHISRLRRKVEDDPQKPRYIVTLRGHGYTCGIEPQKVSLPGR